MAGCGNVPSSLSLPASGTTSQASPTPGVSATKDYSAFAHRWVSTNESIDLRAMTDGVFDGTKGEFTTLCNISAEMDDSGRLVVAGTGVHTYPVYNCTCGGGVACRNQCAQSQASANAAASGTCTGEIGDTFTLEVVSGSLVLCRPEIANSCVTFTAAE